MGDDDAESNAWQASSIMREDGEPDKQTELKTSFPQRKELKKKEDEEKKKIKEFPKGKGLGSDIVGWVVVVVVVVSSGCGCL